MPLLLDKPLVIPEIHDREEKAYAEVSIVHLAIALSRAELTFTIEYGDTVDGRWQPAPGVESNTISVVNREAVVGADGKEIPADLAYNELVGKTLVPAGAEGTPIYGVIKQSLYEYLVEHHPSYAGAIT